MLVSKRGAMLLETTMRVVILVIIILAVGKGVSYALDNVKLDQEKAQALSTLERFTSFLQDQASGDNLDFADWAGSVGGDTFLMYAPKDYYLVYFSPANTKTPKNYVEGNWACICKEKSCSSEESYCKMIDKPFKIEGKDFIKIGITEFEVSVNEIYTLRNIKESDVRINVCSKPKIEPGIQVVTPSRGFICAPSRGNNEVSLVILHHTAGSSWEGAYVTFLAAPHRVSSHYIIAKDGTIYYIVDEKSNALHAGNDGLYNQRSIGVEIVNTGFEPFTEPQYSSLNALLRDIDRRYDAVKIDNEHIIGHFQTTQGKRDDKTDPSSYFDWAKIGLPDHIRSTIPEQTPV